MTVITLPIEKCFLDIPVSNVLEEAVAHELTEAIVLGLDKDGEFYMAMSQASGPDNLWLIELALERLMDRQED